jgi:hypothetical protein
LASNGNHNGWKQQKERILMYAGLAAIFYEITVPELIGLPFHFKVLLTGLALCGVSITRWADRR